MKLREHIDSKFKGNVSAFARSIDRKRQQVVEWLGYDCTIKSGTITRHKILHKTDK